MNTPRNTTKHRLMPPLLLASTALAVITGLVAGLALFAASSPEQKPVFARQSDLPSCADGAAAMRMLQTPVPVTPEVTTPPPPSATPSEPTPTPLPAPQEDRVGFPAGYPGEFRLLFLFDRPDNRQVRVICGNDLAASRQPGEPFPYGSVMIMETWRARLDENGQPILDENGHYIRETLTNVFVQRKESGFGEAYMENRSGEWEYTAYRPDGSPSIPPARTANCAICHLNQAGEEADFAFRMELFHEGETAMMAPETAENEVAIFIYEFMPMTVTVKAGTTVTWVNLDEAEHTVEAEDGSFESERLPSVLAAGDEPASFSVTFDKPGNYPYFCSIHPAMKAVIEVVE
jgi:plastocyanin